MSLFISLLSVSCEIDGFNLSSARGSTGDNLIIKKLIKETIIRSGITCKIRLDIYFKNYTFVNPHIP